MLEHNVDETQMVNEKENSVVVEAIEDETPPMQQKLKGCCHGRSKRCATPRF